METSIPTPDLILSLIKDDLINTRLVTGLDELGFDAGHYLLNLGSTILHLMGFADGHLTDAVYEHYYTLTRRAAHVNLAKTHVLLDVLAQEIYEELQTLLPHTA